MSEPLPPDVEEALQGLRYYPRKTALDAHEADLAETRVRAYIESLEKKQDWLARMLSKSPMRYPHLVCIQDISDGTDLWIRAAEEATRDE